MSSPSANTEDRRLVSAWGPQQPGVGGHDGSIPGSQPQNLVKTLWRKFLAMGELERTWLMASLMLMLVVLYLLWPILFSLRVDGDTSMSWSTVWIPLWVIDALVTLFFLLFLGWGPISAPPGMEEGWRDPFPMELRALELFQWLVLVLFQFFLVMRLDGRTEWSWWKVLSPLMLWLGVNTLGGLYSLYIQTHRLLSATVIAAFKIVVPNVVLMIQLVFLVLKVEGKMDWNWWVVFIPLWLYSLGSFLGWVGLEGQDFTQTHLDEHSLHVGGEVSTRGVSCCSFIMAIAAVNLLNGADYSTFVVFIPVFLLACPTLCLLPLVFCAKNEQPPEGGDGISHYAGEEPPRSQSTSASRPGVASSSVGDRVPGRLGQSGVPRVTNAHGTQGTYGSILTKEPEYFHPA